MGNTDSTPVVADPSPTCRSDYKKILGKRIQTDLPPYLPPITGNKMNSETCGIQCKKDRTCQSYWNDAEKCYMATSRFPNGTSDPNALYCAKTVDSDWANSLSFNQYNAETDARNNDPNDVIRIIQNDQMDENDCKVECRSKRECKASVFDPVAKTCILKKTYYNHIPSTTIKIYAKNKIEDERYISKGVKPPPFSCQDSPSSQTEENMMTLEACKNALDCYTKLIQHNNDIIAYNDEQRNALRKQRDAYNSRYLQNYDAVIRWKIARDIKEHELYKERKGGSCEESGKCRNSNCPAGWEDEVVNRPDGGNCDICFIGICAETGCRKNCRRTSDEVKKLMNEWDMNNPKPIFTEKNPLQVDYPLAEQNKTYGIIQCCSNFMDIKGSGTGNIQECEQTVVSLIKMSSDDAITIIPPANPTDQPSSQSLQPSQPSQPSQQSTSVSPPKVPEHPEDGLSNDMIARIVIGVVLFLAIVVFSIYKLKKIRSTK
jgi:hypothetical protein